MVLATSLDPATTMGQMARLTVPLLADLCVIDLRDPDGSIRDAAVAAFDDELARGLEELRRRLPLDPHGDHPVACVLRSGEPVLLAEMSDAQLHSFAEHSEHARFMIEHGYRTAIVAPLQARERTLGAISVLRLGEGAPYDEDDLELVCELARRAALAIDNARLFSDLRRVEQRLETILVTLAEAITVSDEHGRLVFANQAAADLLGMASPGEVMRATPAKLMARHRVLDEHGRELDLDAMPSRRLFRGEQPEPLLARSIVLATGEERWLLVRSSPVMDTETGRMLYAVNVIENITELKRAQLAESAIARTLQRSLLPERLPDVPGVELRALYAAAGEFNEVGGDFYDVMLQSDSCFTLIIGDVCGKGPRAAGVTALARHTLRAAAMSGQSPQDMLVTLHRALREQPLGADLCTVCLVTVQSANGAWGEHAAGSPNGAGRVDGVGGEDGCARLTVALAGHPAPLLVDRTGAVREIGRSGTLLGVVEPVRIEASEVSMHAGETLLLYTDGVSEAGAPASPLGERGLHELCARAPQLPLGELLERIERAALARTDNRLRDDIAMLALRCRTEAMR